MPTRAEFLQGLTPLTSLPEDIEDDCPICSEPFTEPVAICEKHIFCKACAINWLTRLRRNTCPTCRREAFPLAIGERLIVGADRLRVVAEALQWSRLLTNDFDEYGYHEYTTSEIQRAVASANNYLAEDDHEASSRTGVLIDMRVVGPHLIAQGNLLREYARATGRHYSGYQCRDWKIILDTLRRTLQGSNGDTLNMEEMQVMHERLHAEIGRVMEEEGLDIYSSGFFNFDGQLESPAGDLYFLSEYLMYQCAKAYDRRETQRAAHQRAQQQALRNESTRFGRALRRFGQRLFGGV